MSSAASWRRRRLQPIALLKRYSAHLLGSAAELVERSGISTRRRQCFVDAVSLRGTLCTSQAVWSHLALCSMETGCRMMWTMAQNQRLRVTQVLVFGSIHQGAILVHVFEPQPCGLWHDGHWLQMWLWVKTVCPTWNPGNGNTD